jgi:hypothetical protein
MGLITAERDWGTINLDTKSGIILVREDWKYTWQVLGAGLTPWTPHEELAFHKRLNRQIWGRWSSHFHVHVRGSSAFATQFARKTLELDFGVRWVVRNEQWTVEVIKVPPGTSVMVARSGVERVRHHIRLYSIIFKPYSAANDAGVSRRGFFSGPHEFGHTMGDPDEYRRASPHLRDTDSLMNVGHKLRARHAHLVIEVLNTMIPGTTFYV